MSPILTAEARIFSGLMATWHIWEPPVGFTRAGHFSLRRGGGGLITFALMSRERGETAASRDLRWRTTEELREIARDFEHTLKVLELEAELSNSMARRQLSTN